VIKSWQSPWTFRGLGVYQSSLENRCECTISPLAVLITAAGIQGEQPLANATTYVREVGKIDLYYGP